MNRAPTLATACAALLPKGDVAGDPAKPASLVVSQAPTLATACAALPPKGDVAGDPAKPASRLELPVETTSAALPWELFICKACGLIYDEAKGDEDSGLAAGTRFADIPDDWACPLCGVTKADFEPYVHEEVRTVASSHRPAGARHDAGVVIVGAGRAGWEMAQSLRARDAGIPITLVSACNADMYDKPMISVALAKGMHPDDMPRETGAAAAARLNVRLLPRTQAVRVLPGSRQLRTTRGTLRYRHLVLAHGAQARSLPQFPAALCWRINHLAAYAKFRAALAAAGSAPQRILIAGAGLVGAELANDLALAGHAVALLDVQPRPLANCLSDEQSQQLLEAWAGLPLTFVGGVEVASVTVAAEGNEPPTTSKRVTTTGGQVFTADHVVVCAGLQTPGRLAQGAGLAWRNGIAVQPGTLATNIEGIHALGDCIAIDGQVSRYIEPIARQAQTLAASVLGQAAVPYDSTRVPLRVKTGSLRFTL